MFVNEMFCLGTINELESRIIHNDYVNEVAQLYAFHKFGITYLVSAGGGQSKNNKRYKCQFYGSCFFVFKRLPDTEFFRLDSEDYEPKYHKRGTLDEVIVYPYNYYKPKSDNNNSCNKLIHEDNCSMRGFDSNSITNVHLVLNHPYFKTCYHKTCGDNPIHAIYSSSTKKNDLLLEDFTKETGYHLHHKVQGKVVGLSRSRKQS